MKEDWNKGIVNIGFVLAFLLLIPMLSCQGKSEQSKSPAIPSFEVSVMKSVSLPNRQVLGDDNPFLGAGSHTPYNLALVLQVTNTTSNIVRLNNKQLKVQIVDDINTRHDAFGYTPMEIGSAENKYGIRLRVNITKNNMRAIDYIFNLPNGATLNADRVIDKQQGLERWTIQLPVGKPTILSCIFNIPPNRRAVQVALPGVKDLITLPVTPPSVR